VFIEASGSGEASRPCLGFQEAIPCGPPIHDGNMILIRATPHGLQIPGFHLTRLAEPLPSARVLREKRSRRAEVGEGHRGVEGRHREARPSSMAVSAGQQKAERWRSARSSAWTYGPCCVGWRKNPRGPLTEMVGGSCETVMRAWLPWA